VKEEGKRLLVTPSHPPSQLIKRGETELVCLRKEGREGGRKGWL
jgi:hypothetical protein